MRQYCVSVLGNHLASIWAEGHEQAASEDSIGLTGGKEGGYVAVLNIRDGIGLSYRVYDGEGGVVETAVPVPLPKVNAAGATQSEDCAIAQPDGE